MKRYSNKIIENTIEKAAKSLSKTLSKFYPAYEKNGINERNLTFYFAHLFAKRFGSYAIMEIPFLNKKSKKHDKHIDAYLFNEGIGIFLESKRIVNLEKAKEVSKDLSKMNHENLFYIINKCHLKKSPKRIYTLVLGESWNKSINDWWKNGETKNKEWDNINFPYKMCYGQKFIKSWPDENCTLSWLYGYREIRLNT